MLTQQPPAKVTVVLCTPSPPNFNVGGESPRRAEKKEGQIIHPNNVEIWGCGEKATACQTTVTFAGSCWVSTLLFLKCYGKQAHGDAPFLLYDDDNSDWKDDVQFATTLEKSGDSTIHGAYKKMTAQAKA